MNEGKVIYERTLLQFRGNIPEGAENIPREQNDKFGLSFANNQSLWESIPDMDDNNDFGGGGSEGNGSRVSIRFEVGDDKAYHNFETGRRWTSVN